MYCIFLLIMLSIIHMTFYICIFMNSNYSDHYDGLLWLLYSCHYFSDIQVSRQVSK